MKSAQEIRRNKSIEFCGPDYSNYFAIVNGYFVPRTSVSSLLRVEGVSEIYIQAEMNTWETLKFYYSKRVNVSLTVASWMDSLELMYEIIFSDFLAGRRVIGDSVESAICLVQEGVEYIWLTINAKTCMPEAEKIIVKRKNIDCRAMGVGVLVKTSRGELFIPNRDLGLCYEDDFMSIDAGIPGVLLYSDSKIETLLRDCF